ncbi:unnamed protein product [Rhizoctonia solani]|uniref:Uncharacterized protein n=1 Tax=Rhizoctonia solani TaxID=456999 RepID=A0A8H3C887_9AGAM|nr:unnamed protein product [Rhizoctonia solani]
MASELWEEARTRLENAISMYLDSCLGLEKSTSTVPLVGIDNTPACLTANNQIECFHTRMVELLNQSHAALARTRNRLVTPIYRIPPEILGKIFEFAVDGINKNLPMDLDGF